MVQKIYGCHYFKDCIYIALVVYCYALVCVVNFHKM